MKRLIQKYRDSVGTGYQLMFLDMFVLTLLCFLIISSLYRMFILGLGGEDDLEHEAAAWFIYNGFIPYHDFFQHHHPLLWYIMVPVFTFLDHPIEIYRIGRIVAAIFFFGGFYWIKKIIFSLGGNARSFLYTAFFYFSFPITIGKYIQNRPDTYMIFCLLAGVYFWIRYVQEHKTKQLISSYLFLFLSFAFLQKALLFFIPFGIYQLYLLFSKKLPWKQLFVAIVFPVFICIAYMAYLGYSDSLIRYWELNWILNAHWYRNYRCYQYDFFSLLFIFNILVVSIYTSYKGKGLLKHLSILFLGFSLLFLIISKPYFHYWLIWIGFSSIFMGFIFSKTIISRNVVLKLWTKVILLLCILTATVNIYFDGFKGISSLERDFYELDSFVVQPFEKSIRYITQNMKSPQDVVDYGHFLGFFLRPYPVHYYYFALDRGAIIDSKMFHKYDLPDLDRIVMKQKPKFLIYQEIYDKTQADDDSTEIKAYTLPDDFLEENYRLKYGFFLERTD